MYDQISTSINHKYVEIIDNISKNNLTNVYWWVSSLASRDNNLSKLFHYLCCIELLIQIKDTIIKNDYIIIVDNYELKLIIFNIIGHSVNIKLDRTRKYKIIFKKLRNIIYSIIYSLVYHLMVNIFYSSNKFNNDNELILIDNYMLPQHEKYDHYYGDMLDYICDQYKNNIYYVYTLNGYRITNLYNGLRLLNINKFQHTFKELYLKATDYIYAYLYIFKIYDINIDDISYNNINIKNLVIRDLYDNHNIYASIMALLNFRMFYRLKLMKYKVKSSVNWFENQPLDKGWNIGLNKYYPAANIHGYIGSLVYCSNYVAPYPTGIEQKANVLPKSYFLPGRSHIKSFKSYNSALSVEIAPAFRFSYIYNIKKADNNCSILVCLDGMSLKSDLNVIETIYRIKKYFRNIEFLVRPHPCINLGLLNNYLENKCIEELKFDDSDIMDSISSATILISNGVTSVCVIALLLGIPVIILAKNNGFTYMPMNNINKKILSVCYTSQEIIVCIGKYIKFVQNHHDQSISSYVQPIDNYKINRLLGYY